MNKSLRRLAIMIATVCVLAIMAVPVFADHGMSGKGAGYYMADSETITTYSTDDEVKVKVIVQGRYSTDNNPIAIEAKRTVTLTGHTSYTVRDAISQFNTESSTYKAYDRLGQLIEDDSNSEVVASFVNGSRTWGSLFYYDILNLNYRVYVDGWMFRVNGRCPMKVDTANPSSPYPIGAMMYETPIKAGDVITYFYNYPFTISGTDYSTKFIAADTKYTPNANPNQPGTLQVQLQSSRDNHYDTDEQWTVTNYSDFAPGSTKYASLYNSSFNYIAMITLDSTGYGTLSKKLDPGVYYLDIGGTKSFKTITGYIQPTGNDTASCSCLDTTLVYDRFVIS